MHDSNPYEPPQVVAMSVANDSIAPIRPTSVRAAVFVFTLGLVAQIVCVLAAETFLIESARPGGASDATTILWSLIAVAFAISVAIVVAAYRMRLWGWFALELLPSCLALTFFLASRG